MSRPLPSSRRSTAGWRLTGSACRWRCSSPPPPPALRVEGELDLTNGPVLARVIRARLAASPRLRVDLGGVAFADVGSLREIYQIAVGLPAGGQITLANVTEPVRRVLDLAGFRADAVVIES